MNSLTAHRILFGGTPSFDKNCKPCWSRSKAGSSKQYAPPAPTPPPAFRASQPFTQAANPIQFHDPRSQSIHPGNGYEEAPRGNPTFFQNTQAGVMSNRTKLGETFGRGRVAELRGSESQPHTGSRLSRDASFHSNHLKNSVNDLSANRSRPHSNYRDRTAGVSNILTGDNSRTDPTVGHKGSRAGLSSSHFITGQSGSRGGSRAGSKVNSLKSVQSMGDPVRGRSRL